MWDDEDNNPYGSFNRRDSETSDAPAFRQAPSTPPSGASSPPQSTPEYHRPESTYHDEPFGHDQQDSDHHDDDDDEDVSQSRRIEPKKGGYHSRIEQILYENPDLEIQIVHAGKNTEGGGSYITYTIRTGDIEVRRRYSEFASLRA
ncbi:hypothetical protein KCU60_g8258, partial [Aureobasidium melanogenum]